MEAAVVVTHDDPCSVISLNYIFFICRVLTKTLAAGWTRRRSQAAASPRAGWAGRRKVDALSALSGSLLPFVRGVWCARDGGTRIVGESVPRWARDRSPVEPPLSPFHYRKTAARTKRSARRFYCEQNEALQRCKAPVGIVYVTAHAGVDDASLLVCMDAPRPAWTHPCCAWFGGVRAIGSWCWTLSNAFPSHDLPSVHFWAFWTVHGAVAFSEAPHPAWTDPCCQCGVRGAAIALRVGARIVDVDQHEGVHEPARDHHLPVRGRRVRRLHQRASYRAT